MSPHGGLMSQNQNPMISSESTNQNRFENSQSNRFFDSRIPALVPQEITDQDLNLFNDIKSCDQMDTEPRIKTETGSNQFQPTRLPPPIPPKPHSMRMNQSRDHGEPTQNMSRDNDTQGIQVTQGIQNTQGIQPQARSKTAKEMRGSDPTIKMLKCTQGGSYRFSMRSVNFHFFF